MSRLLTALRAIVLATLACSTSGCPDPVAARPHPGDGGAPVVRPLPDAGTGPGQAEPHIVRRSRALMGTIFEIMVVGDGPAIEGAIAAAFDEVAHLEDIMSEWRPESEISRINAAAGEQAVVVDPELVAVIQEGLRIAELSGGKFDITWAALRGLWDFKAEDPRPPTRAEALSRARLVNYRDVVIDTARHSVMLRRHGMAIGLGGIAKGYALDRASDTIKARGLTDFIIYGGGQVLISGQKGNRPWRVGIQHPRRRDVYFAYFSPGPGSVATSGDYEHYFIRDGVRYHHILDPATGFPSNASIAVTVVAPTALAADAIDTALFILGPTEGMALARQVGIQALFIDPQMQVTMTDGFRRELTIMPITPTDTSAR